MTEKFEVCDRPEKDLFPCQSRIATVKPISSPQTGIFQPELISGGTFVRIKTSGKPPAPYVRHGANSPVGKR
ncbi:MULTISPECIES: hypothetical protein [unclassified Microcoleus]|uniref:hypothetical protein n=1 Tax=unclassified Microcoleus TaxID=2642155 RepID=UPI002FD79E1D